MAVTTDAEAEEVVDILYDIAFSLKSFTPRLFEHDASDFEAMAGLNLEFESIKYLSYNFRRNFRKGTVKKMPPDILIQAAAKAEKVLNSEIFRLTLASRQFRNATPNAEKRRQESKLSDSSNEEALLLFVRYAREVYEYINSGHGYKELDLFESRPVGTLKAEIATRVKSIVPDQNVGPAQFDVINSRLIVVHVDAIAAKRDVANVNSAKGVLIDQGRVLLEQLRRSNCDKRLLENVENLQSKMESEKDIIELGILNIGAELMCSHHKDELSDAMLAMFRAQTTGIGMYVSQFSEWAQFQENAAQANLSNSDIEEVEKIASDLSDRLKRDPDFVDAEVPKTIDFLLSIVRKPGAMVKKIGFALIRTIENLVAKIFSYGIDFIDGSIKETSKLGKKSVAVILIGLALESAANLSPITAKLGDAKWMAEACKLVKELVGATKSE